MPLKKRAVLFVSEIGIASHHQPGFHIHGNCLEKAGQNIIQRRDRNYKPTESKSVLRLLTLQRFHRLHKKLAPSYEFAMSQQFYTI